MSCYRLFLSAVAAVALPVHAGDCWVPEPLGFRTVSDSGDCANGEVYIDPRPPLCVAADGTDMLMLWDSEANAPRCLNADELSDRARSACADGYEAASLAHIDADWPPLAVRQYAAGNPPGPRVACYASDLARVDAALSAAVADLDGLTAEQMDPCPTVTWPEMRYYTDADIAAGAETCAD
jgi:hypothetical protein